MCVTKGIACSEKFSLIETLGEEMQSREWMRLGLPTDNFSIENAIIATNAKRYPLMIDPQCELVLLLRTSSVRKL